LASSGCFICSIFVPNAMKGAKLSFAIGVR
jgi:hypothetical protein